MTNQPPSFYYTEVRACASTRLASCFLWSILCLAKQQMVSVILSSCLIIREGTGGKTNEKRWFRGTDHPATLSSSGSVMDTRPPHPAVFSDENDHHHHHTGMINMNLMNVSTKEGLQSKTINKSYKVFIFFGSTYPSRCLDCQVSNLLGNIHEPDLCLADTDTVFTQTCSHYFLKSMIKSTDPDIM